MSPASPSAHAISHTSLTGVSPNPAAPSTDGTSAPAAEAPQPLPRELQFSEANHSRIVTAIRTQLLPKGGTMQIRLDPPNLGMLELAVRMQDGVMSVAFQTSSEESTRLLSHSLSHLKQVLESQGLNVDRLHVQQAPRDEQSTRDGAHEQRGGFDDDSPARQEQQRREVLRRMWRRLALGGDPLDLVA